MDSYAECPLLFLGSCFLLLQQLGSLICIVGSGELSWYGTIVQEYEVKNAQLQK